MRITFSVMPTGLTQPITSGAAPVEGVELEVFRPKTTDANSRAMLQMEYDVGEMSIAAFTKARELGLPLRAIPVFTSGRRFVQSGIYLSKASGLTSPDQLSGRTIGLPQYWISSCVWQRHVLETMHGIAPEKASWVTVEPERFEGGLPAAVELRTVGGGDLAALMRAGEIDACLLQGGRPLPEELAELTVPAYPDLVSAERDYYRADGLLPLLHVTVIKEELAEAEPALVPALLAAYSEAKDIASSDPATEWPLPPLGHRLPELRELLGGDPWPYGVAANRQAIETFLTTAADQGLVSHRFEVDELFVDDLPAAFA
ncbi:ABC transporter substrate-binding protein [Nocardioides sp. LHG3406-4]|uniref:ABC transporter substrate-binding protein n=1 Tax=Nocardioides sp. LHG3406-4 TaxID=2804575 RepID=UPI003CF582C6